MLKMMKWGCATLDPAQWQVMMAHAAAVLACGVAVVPRFPSPPCRWGGGLSPPTVGLLPVFLVGSVVVVVPALRAVQLCS